MIFIGIDAAKDKHDCFIVSLDGGVLCDVFTISNTLDGFNDLLSKIKSFSKDLSKTKVGLEATGHYSYNLLGFLLDNGFPTYVLNPLHTNLYRKSLSLRKNKNRQGRRSHDCFYANVLSKLKALHKSIIPQRRTKVTNKIQI